MNRSLTSCLPSWLLPLLLFTLLLGAGTATSYADTGYNTELLAGHADHDGPDNSHSDHTNANGAGHHHASAPPAWLVGPFVLLLIMIATGPLFYAHFWHKNYPIVAGVLGAIVVIYYLAVLHNEHQPVHSLAEYASFIALLTALFVASGGILIKVDRAGTPMVNVVMLVFGAAIANIIGTTGASMLLIRPFMRLNQDRIQPYHVVFFIFAVSNVGGCLTPIGDPPLFLGFLKGVPFEWTIIHIWPAWIFGIALLCLMFFFLDQRNYRKATPDNTTQYSGKIEIIGLKNMIWLVVTIFAVFLDPNVIDGVPYIPYHGDKLSFLRELIMFGVAIAAFKTSDKEALKGNEFNFEPIREVAFLFIGIFATMMPALELIGAYAKGHPDLISTNSLYWMTGSLSGVLDNAPTYLNFLSAGMGKVGLNLADKGDVMVFVEGTKSAETSIFLLAISIASVFFGAMTYIGNAPNFMVKSIAEQAGITMPSFAGYVIRYSIPFLLPILLLTWLVFFVLT